ncbi:hypothetical protein PSACC_03547 [Paramicrosporidium saccamoebae]|uniref:Uncharacterized protein n=1 Tax=Paramicrosporidium saccamoebae TaxID=1246581 RepID=A0A2H9TFJ3_9FUNG|nr:hypothetical protein PSACC_03547 [Paramicrosporidium saccamoebae]
MYFPHLLVLVLAGVVYASKGLSISFDVYYALKSDLADEYPEMRAPPVPTGTFPDVWMKLKESCRSYRDPLDRQNCSRMIWRTFVFVKAYELLKPTTMKLQFFEGESALYNRIGDLLSHMFGSKITKVVFGNIHYADNLGEFKGTTIEAAQTIKPLLTKMQEKYRPGSASKSLKTQASPSKSANQGSHDSPSKSTSHASPSKSTSHASPSKSTSHASSSKSTSHGSPSKSKSHGSPSKSATHGSPSKSASKASPSPSKSVSSQATTSKHSSTQSSPSKSLSNRTSSRLLNPQASISESLIAQISASNLASAYNGSHLSPTKAQLHVNKARSGSSHKSQSKTDRSSSGVSGGKLESRKASESPSKMSLGAPSPSMLSPQRGQRSAGQKSDTTTSPTHGRKAVYCDEDKERPPCKTSRQLFGSSQSESSEDMAPVVLSPSRAPAQSQLVSRSILNPKNAYSSSVGRSSTRTLRSDISTSIRASSTDTFWSIQSKFYEVALAGFSLVDTWCASYRNSRVAVEVPVEFWVREFGPLQTLLNDVLSRVDLSNFGNLSSDLMLTRLKEFKNVLQTAVNRKNVRLPPNVENFVTTMLENIKISALFRNSEGELFEHVELLKAFLNGPYVGLVGIDIFGWSRLFWLLAAGQIDPSERPMECLNIINNAITTKSLKTLTAGRSCFGALARIIK